MTEKNTRIVEIDGVKLEIDLSTAKVMTEYRVGDPVKVLIKNYGDTFDVYPGIIASFDNFKELPSITVAYMKRGELTEMIINAKSKGGEIAPASELDLHLSREDVLKTMDRDLEKAEAEVAKKRQAREYFLRRFGAYFKGAEAFEAAMAT